ncbi:MAG: hypothetical protein ABI885_11345 [Gammaproteobacteria bacterium]
MWTKKYASHDLHDQDYGWDMGNRIHVTALLVLASNLAFAVGDKSVSSMSQLNGPIPFELTGTVLDKDTKEPISGAFVIASYFAPITNRLGSGNWWVKSRGTYSDSAGSFRFPVED